MGTRCLTVFLDEKQKEIAVLYRQFDGYPDGHGADLHEFLKGRRIVNGYRGGEDKGNSNGMPNLVVQLISFLFRDHTIGGYYLYPEGTRDCWEDYQYTIYVHPERSQQKFLDRDILVPFLKVEACYGDGRVLYDGPADDFNPKEDFFGDDEDEDDVEAEVETEEASALF